MSSRKPKKRKAPQRRDKIDDVLFAVANNKGEMTNESFRLLLDNITKKKQSLETTRIFLETLAKGYLQDLEIPIVGVFSSRDAKVFNQCCLLNDEGKKAMLYLTDRKHFVPDKYMAPAVGTYQPVYISAYVRDVIDNAIDKEEVDALFFNTGTSRQYVIPKILLMMSFVKCGAIELTDDEEDDEDDEDDDEEEE